MKLKTITHVSVDGVMQGLGGSDEDRRSGFERGGWALPLFGGEAATFLDEVIQRADAFLFGRRTYEIFASSWGTGSWGADQGDNPISVALNRRPKYVASIGQSTRLFPATGPDAALDLVDSRVTPSGVTIQVYRPTGRPQYATADSEHVT
jgi:dihydrofolate reductase